MTVSRGDALPIDQPRPSDTTAMDIDLAQGGENVRDVELLRRYVRLQDEAAFAELVHRHSRLVMGVCRRVLRREHDIEDAFQATFLVLARDAARIRKSESLASWLHGVAYRTSRRAADTSSRRSRLLRDIVMNEAQTNHAANNDPLAQVEARHEQQALDEELALLPDKYRAPLVLHYLEGKSNQEVSEELGLTVTALEGRLKRGKKELRLRLARRGIGLSVAVAAMHAVSSAAQAAPLDTLIARTIDAGLSYAGGQAAGPIYTPEAARLAGQEIAAMSTTSAVTLVAIIALPLALAVPGHGDAPVVDQPVPSMPMITSVDSDTRTNDPSRVEPLMLSQAKSTDELLSLFDETSVSRDEKMTPSEQRIVQALDRDADFTVTDVPLSQVVDLLSKALKVNSVLDTSAWRRTGVDPEQRVDVDMTDVTFREGLKNLLEPLGLAAFVADEVLMFSSKEAAQRNAKKRRRQQQQDEQIADPDRQRAKLLRNSIVTRYDERTANVEKIESKMKADTKVEFVDTPLADAVDYISQMHDIPILIDETGLNDVGIPVDEPINLIMNGAQLKSVLNIMLRGLGLTTIIRDELLVVTTKEAADKLQETRVYDVRNVGMDAEKLLSLLEDSIPDAQWKSSSEVGGTVNAIDGALVVQQTQAVHEKIVDLIAQLQRFRAATSAGDKSGGALAIDREE